MGSAGPGASRRRQRRSLRAKVGLSSASVYPESTAAAFEIAARLGYDGVEVMVWNDPISQDMAAVKRLSDYHGVPVLAVHSPCLVITQRVWSPDPWEKLERARSMAEFLGANTVVVHPPFRWQRDYVKTFTDGIDRMSNETDVKFAVENMFPLRVRGREVSPYLPTWDVATVAAEPEEIRNRFDYWVERHPTEGGHGPADLQSLLAYRHFTLDISHTSVSNSDSEAMLASMGDAMTHLHIADGTGLAKDEHLVPGRGTQPCDRILETLAARDFDGNIVVEVNTRRAANREEREADLAEALQFCRLHLAAPALR